MGRLGNALRRGFSGNGRKKKKAGKVAGGCLFAFFSVSVISVCLIYIVTLNVRGWVEDVGEGLRNAVAGSPSQASKTIEEMVVDGDGLPEMSDDMKADSLLQCVSVEELVLGTISPFGEKGDGDARFGDIVIKTEAVQTVNLHPSEDDIAEFRAGERARMYEAKRKALEEAAGPAATPSPSPAATPSPVPVQKPGSGKKDRGDGSRRMMTLSARTRSVPSVNADVRPAAGAATTPSPVPSPVPEPTWDESDDEMLELRVERYIADNTRTEVRNVFIDRTVDGEQLRTYLNSFHTPWQTNYSEAAFIAIYDYGFDRDDDAAINAEIVDRVFGYGNMLEYHLYLDYWADTDYWTETGFLYDERETVFGGDKTAYEDYETDYGDDPVMLDSRTDLVMEKGFIPLVLFNDISDWAVKTTYGDRTDDGKNAFGFPVQTESGYETSVSFNSFCEGMELYDTDLDMFVEAYGMMPECVDQYAKLTKVVGFYKPGYYNSGVVVSNFAHLTGGDAGARAAYRALEIVAANPVYSQANREGAGCYDCSSFVSRVYDDIGIGNFRNGGSLNTEGLLHYFDAHPEIVVVSGGWPDDEDILQPGDILLFAKEGKKHDRGVYHAGMWIGGGYIADASSSLGHVVYRQMWGRNEIIVIARPSLLQ